MTIDNTEITVHRLSFPFTLFAKGMVYNGKIYTHPNPSNRLIRHEMIHVAQGFKLRTYLWWWLKRGYKNNPFEREARYLQGTYRGWKLVSEKSWRKYI